MTADAVLDICAAEQPAGVIAQLGGQTPLRLARTLRKISEGSPSVGEVIAVGGVALVINTPRGGHGARTDGHEIRAADVRAGIPCITAIEAGGAAAAAIASRRPSPPRPLQDAGLPGPAGRAFQPGTATV